MHISGRLSDAEWWAAERFRDDWSMLAASGIGAMQWGAKRGKGGGQGWLPGDALLAATRRMRESDRKMGPFLRVVATLLIIDGRSMAEVGTIVKRAKARIGTDLRAILALLIECYAGRRLAAEQ